MTSLNQSSGGIRRIVGIDKTVVRKRKFNIGRSVREYWVISTSLSIIGRSLVYTIDHYKRNAIYTDDWRAYRRISRLRYVHRVAVHKRRFVDPTMGIYTKNIGAMWSRLKEFLRPCHGSRNQWLCSYIDEFLYRMHHNLKTAEPLSNLEELLNHVKEVYSP